MSLTNQGQGSRIYLAVVGSIYLAFLTRGFRIGPRTITALQDLSETQARD